MNDAETMREFKNAVEVCEQLNEFSFRNIVKRNTGLFEKKGVKTPVEWSEYNRNAIRANAAEGFCALCGAEESCVKKGNRKFNLKYICHGSHSLDFCRSIRKNNGGKLFDDVRSHPEDWNFTPVLFLMENPSNQKKFGGGELTVYEQNEEGKCPSADWHWIYGGYNEEELIYPKKFINGAYGGLIASVVRMFRLGNAYVTDAVKCSMNCEEMFLGTDEYEPECVKKCPYSLSVQPCGVHRTHPECDPQDREQMCRLVEQKNVPAAQHALQSRTSSAPPPRPMASTWSTSAW